MNLIPIVLNGGVGSRLWPVSRESRPKPFMPLPDGETLLQKTYHRALSLGSIDKLITVTNDDFSLASQAEWQKVCTAQPIAQHAEHCLILEPVGRNTAAAVACAALETAQAFGGDAVMLVLASDHIILDNPAFGQSVTEATQLAAQNRLVTFGIRPDVAHTGYGYIEADGSRVVRFVEKPDAATAVGFLAAGNYLWNAGIFCATADCFLSELKTHASAIFETAHAAWNQGKRQSLTGYRSVSLDKTAFAAVPSISIDYAVMEKTQIGAVVHCSAGWSDVGSWDSVSELTAADAQGNRLIGNSLAHDCKDTFVWSAGRVAVASGVEGLIIVDTPDALLVTNRGRSQDVKQVVAALQAKAPQVLKTHQTVHRPWGSYTELDSGPGFKVKRIEVNPGGALSLQLHHHRSEHWVVSVGTATVTVADKESTVHAGGYVFIPVGAKHRLVNQTEDVLIMHEVQIGAIVEESDIVRFDDIYGRTSVSHEQPSQ